MFEVFQTFSKSELSFFEAYLKTNYFNGSSILLKLYKNLLLFPVYDRDEIIGSVVNNERILGRAYPEQAVIDYHYKLVVKAKEFLSFKRYLDDEYKMNELLLEELDRRNLEKGFMKLFREMHRVTSEERDSTQKYHKLYFLYEKMFNFTERNNYILKHDETGERIRIIQKISQYKSIYHFMEQVSLFATFKVNLYSYGEKDSAETLFKTDLLNVLYSNIHNREKLPLLNLYYKLFMMFEKIDDTDFYHDCKKYFLEINTVIDPEEVKHHFQFLIKYCHVKKLVTDDEFFTGELLELNKIYLENRLYTHEGEKYIQTRSILNIIKLFKISGNMDWIKDFVEQNDDVFNPKDKKSIRHFLKVYYSFLKDDYRTALNEINKIDLDRFTFKYEVQTLRIRLLYDLGDENVESALSNIESYKFGLKNDKFLLPETKEKTLNFLKHLEKLIRKSGNKKYLEPFYDSLKKEKHVNFKKWLIKEYEKNLQL